MISKYDVLVFSFYPPAFVAGGPVRSIEALIDYTKNDISYLLFSKDKFYNCPDSINYDYNLKNPKILTYNKLSFIRLFILCNKYQFKFIYINSFFSIFQVFYSVLCSIVFGIKITVSLRGQLEEGAMVKNRLIKNIYIYIFKLLMKKYIHIYHSTSRSETLNILNKLNIPSDKIVEITNLRNFSINHKFFNISSKKDDYLKAVFYSRIVPKKNLLQLLNLIYNSNLKSVSLDIYGNIEDFSYWLNCLNVINANLNNKDVLVTYKGQIENSSLYYVLSQYDLFIFPTLSENYGHVIVEALISGVPILINDTTPFSNDILEFNIGDVIDFNDNLSFSSSINSYKNMDDNDYLLIKKSILRYLRILESNNIKISKMYKKMFTYEK